MATFPEICAVLGRHVSASSARTIARMAITRVGVDERSLPSLADPAPLLRELSRGLDLFSVLPTARRRCHDQLAQLFGGGASLAPSGPSELRVPIRDETHIVEARTLARSLAAELGFGRTDQVKVATVVSELARNIYHYASEGLIVLRRAEPPRRGVVIEASDEGPGIADLDTILAGGYRSRTGLGLGLIGCRNLMDELVIDSAPGKGTRVRAAMYR